MHKAVILAFAAGMAGSAFARGGGPGTVGIGQDLDGNGTVETQGSFLRRSLGALGAGATVSFSYAFMTDEFYDPDPYNDMFRVRLYDMDTDETLAQFGGAVDDESYDADEGYSAFDFTSPDVGSVRTTLAQGASFFFESGVIGWSQMTLTVPAAVGAGDIPTNNIGIEFLVADSDDTAVETGLAIDDIVVHEATGAPVVLSNSGFEIGSLSDWSAEGTVMLLSSLFEGPEGGKGEAGLPVAFSANSGEFFTLLVTQGIPTPGAATLSGLALLAGLRRRR